MSIEEAIAKDLVAVLFVTFLFGGARCGSSSPRSPSSGGNFAWRTATRRLKQSMVAAGFRPDEIVKVLNAGGGSS